ncbi:MAG: hypothetical protein KBI09_09505 [Mesotoga sp.]|nr:hypothetical protein [Mesotoga sp.]HRR44831.1 hypothetical protein [Mesotoga sp.]
MHLIETENSITVRITVTNDIISLCGICRYRELIWIRDYSGMIMGRYDERDAMFSRMAYKKGSPQYEEYYKRHPERQELDDRLRSSNGLCSPTSLFYDPVQS